MNHYSPPGEITAPPKPKFFSSLWKATSVLLFLSIPLLGLLTYLGLLATGKTTNLKPESIGFLLGSAMAGVIWSLLVAFIVFMLSKRSVLAANLTCLIVLGLLSFGSLVSTASLAFARSNSEQASNQRALQNLTQAIEAHKAAAQNLFQNSEEIDQDALQAHSDKGLELLRAAVPTLKGPLRESLQLFITSTDRMNEGSQDYDLWYARFENESLAPFTADEQIEGVAGRIEIIQEWLKANERLRLALQQWTQLKAFRSKLKTAQERQFHQGLTIAMEQQSPLLMSIRDTDREIGETFIAILELHEQEWSNFTPDGGVLNTIFDSPHAQKQLTDFTLQVDKIVARQEAAQKELLTQ